MTILHARFLFRVLAISSLIVPSVAISASISADHVAARSQASATPVASPVGACPEEATFEAFADAYVTMDEPDDNHGMEDQLLTDREPPSEAYLAFEVDGITTGVHSATLRLWVTDKTGHIPQLWLAVAVPWFESELTWNTRPILDVQVGKGIERGTPAGDWMDYDVTSVVHGNGTYTFVLIPVSRDGLDVNSREAGGNAPQLVVQTGDDPESTCRPAAVSATPV
jgi:hypothetical protein